MLPIFLNYKIIGRKEMRELVIQFSYDYPAMFRGNNILTSYYYYYGYSPYWAHCHTNIFTILLIIMCITMSPGP